MAARLNKRQIEKTASAIQATKLVKKLQRHALEGEPLERSQIEAIRILLNKSLPDQRAIEVQAEVEAVIPGFTIVHPE